MHAVYNEVRSLLLAKIITPSKLRLFCSDLCMVASGIRLAYLFDAFSFVDPPKDASRLLTHLRKKIPMFMHVIHVYDPHSDQSFFVNTVLLRALRHNELASLSDAYSFVDLVDSPSLVSTPPLHVTRLVTALYVSIEDDPDATTIQLATNDEGESLVPFAAVLLEYPVAYVPPPTPTVFLSGVPLDVYECNISPTSVTADNSSWIPKSHTLLKFSCPRSVSDQHPHLRPDALKHRIENHFASRITGACLDATVTVSHHTEVHDRVAL